MATDPRKRQKRVERRTAKRKEKKHELIRWQSAGLSARIAAAAKWPPLHAWVANVLWEQGIGNVVISRALPGGSVAAVSFLVDVYCLGVKDVIVQILSRSDYDRRFVREIRSAYPVRDVSFAHARKVVEGAVAYAESLGIPPAADYETARLLFGDVNPADCTETFTFGKDGKPFFVAGPRDTPERCRRIMAALAEHCAPGQYDYLVLANAYGAGRVPPLADDSTEEDRILHLDSGREEF